MTAEKHGKVLNSPEVYWHAPNRLAILPLTVWLMKFAWFARFRIQFEYWSNYYSRLKPLPTRAASHKSRFPQRKVFLWEAASAANKLKLIHYQEKGDLMRKTGLLIVWVAMLATAFPVVSHHSVWAEFDNNNPLELRGRFIEMDWVNPHSWVHLEVIAEDGTMTVWAAETPPPNQLIRMGWRRSDLQEGDEIIVSGFAAKNGTARVWAREVKLVAQNGQELEEARTVMALFEPNPNGIPAGVLPGRN